VTDSTPRDNQGNSPRDALSSAPFAVRLDLARLRIAASPEMAGTAPTWWADQHRAACSDTLTRFRALEQVMGPVGAHSVELPMADAYDTLAHAIAAVWGCDPCPHAPGDAPMMLFADLNRRTLKCARCVDGPLAPIDDDRCEVCGRRGQEFFAPFLIPVGTVLAVGHAGECCLAVMQLEAAP
jgi:hypothetical protein